MREAPAGHLLYVFDEVSGPDLLQHIARCSRHHAGEERLVVGKAGQHQADQLGHDRSDVTTDFDATAIFETDVQNGHMGFGQRNPCERFRRRRSFTDDFNLIVALEQTPDAFPNEFVIIEQEDADRHSTIMTASSLGAYRRGPRPHA